MWQEYILLYKAYQIIKHHSNSDWLRWMACSLFSIHWDIETRRRCDMELHSQMSVMSASSELLGAAMEPLIQGLLFLLSVLSLGSAPQRLDQIISDLMSWLCCESTSTYDIRMIPIGSVWSWIMHILWFRGVNIKCNLNAGSQKRDVDASDASSWRQSSFQDESRRSHCEFVALQGSWNQSTEGAVGQSLITFYSTLLCLMIY